MVLDTNVLVAALISPAGHPASIYTAWIAGRFVLVTSREQIEELKTTLAKPKLRKFVGRAQTGEMVNDLKSLALLVTALPAVRRSLDAKDDFLLEIAEGSHADYLVTGDKGHVLSLLRHGSTRIVSASFFCQKVLKLRQTGKAR